MVKRWGNNASQCPCHEWKFAQPRFHSPQPRREVTESGSRKDTSQHNFLSLVYINVDGSVITMSGCVVSNLEIFHKLLEMSGSPPVPSICLNKNQWYAAIIYRALAFSSKSHCLSTIWHKSPADLGFFSPRLSTHGKKTYILPTLLAKYTFLDHQQTPYKYVHPFLLFLLSCFANAGKNSHFWILALRQVLGELLCHLPQMWRSPTKHKCQQRAKPKLFWKEAGKRRAPCFSFWSSVWSSLIIYSVRLYYRRPYRIKKNTCTGYSGEPFKFLPQRY